MSTNPLLKPKPRKFCCCFSVDSDSDSEDPSIHLQRVESEASPSILEPAMYTSKKFAADKIYYLKSHSHTVLATFRHVIVESDVEPCVSAEKLAEIPDEFWKDRYKYFSKFDQGVQLDYTAYNCEVQEKLVKNLVRVVLNRVKIENCLIYPCGIGSIPIQFAKHMNVIVVENESHRRNFLEVNSEIYGVKDKINVVQTEFLETKPNADLVVIWPQLDRKIQLKFMNHLSELSNLIEQSLKISQNICVILPPTLDPYEFIEHLYEFDLNPCVEFVLLFDHTHLKVVACLLGNIVKFASQDIVTSILSKIGMGKRQREFMADVISKLSLKRVLEIMDQAERESEKGSIMESLKSKSRKFIELLKEEESISLDSLVVLYKGSDGDEVARLLEQSNVFFIEVESKGNSYIEINRSRIEGFENINLFVEDFKIKETPNKNSLFLLIAN